MFSKNELLKKREFFNLFFHSISYKNKSWVHISDNIAGVVGGSW